MAKWIPMSEAKPKLKQKVWYYFEITGVAHGTYDVIRGYDCFYGRKGFLCNDVTHWMPKGKLSFIPPVPPEED